MKTWISREIAGAGLILAVGLFSCIYAVENFSMGVLSSPGPGLFPALVGGLMVLTGAIVGVQAVLREVVPEGQKFEARSLFFILLAICIFAAMVETTGYGPGVFVLVVVASFAERSMSMKLRLILAVVLTALAILLFRLILQVPIPVFFEVW